MDIKLSEGAPFRFFYFYLLCRHLALVEEKYSVKMKVEPSELLHRFTFLYVILLANSFIFRVLRPYVTFLMNYLTLSPRHSPLDSVHVSFLAITNENVTASLVARYIALKLRQGFTPRGLLYPMKREYSRLLRLDSMLRKPLFFPFEFLLRRVSQRNYFSTLFRTVIKKLSLFYFHLRYLHLLSSKNALAFDAFLFLVDIFESFLRRRRVSRRALNFGRKYARRYFFYAFFHYHRVQLYYQFFLRLLFHNTAELRYRAKLEE